MALLKLFLLVFILKTVQSNDQEIHKEVRVNIDKEFDLHILEKYDPIKWLPDMRLNFDKLKMPKIVRGELNFENVYLEGFSDGLIKIKADIGIFKQEVFITLTLKKLMFKANYFANAHFTEIVHILKSTGLLQLDLENAELYIKIKINGGIINPVSLEAKELKFDSATNIMLTGLFGNEELSQSIGKETADVLNLLLNHEVALTAINKGLFPIVNAFLYALNLSILG